MNINHVGANFIFFSLPLFAGFGNSGYLGYFERKIYAAYPGDVVRIMCQSEIPPKWYKGSTLLQLRGRYTTRTSSPSGHYLIIEEVSQKDSGEYYCIARRTLGKYFRNRIELLVGSKHQKRVNNYDLQVAFNS